MDAVLLTKHKVLISDGGLATELENKGANLNDHLWSARWVISLDKAMQAANIHPVHSSVMRVMRC